MIVATTPSFYVLQAEGEAAELIASIFSPSVMSDIVGVSILSKDFSNDIEPINELDESIKLLKDGLGTDTVEDVLFNPLFIPMSNEALDETLDAQEKGEEIRFVGMNGNPFAIKSIDISRNDNSLISAVVGYHKFNLPGYEDIIAGQTSFLVN